MIPMQDPIRAPRPEPASGVNTATPLLFPAARARRYPGNQPHKPPRPPAPLASFMSQGRHKHLDRGSLERYLEPASPLRPDHRQGSIPIGRDPRSAASFNQASVKSHPPAALRRLDTTDAKPMAAKGMCVLREIGVRINATTTQATKAPVAALKPNRVSAAHRPVGRHRRGAARRVSAGPQPAADLCVSVRLPVCGNRCGGDRVPGIARPAGERHPGDGGGVVKVFVFDLSSTMPTSTTEERRD